MPPIAAAIGSAADAPAGEMADGELALDLEADDQEEDRQQAVVDPVPQRHAEAGVAEREAEMAAPRTRRRRARAASWSATTARIVASSSSTPADGAQLAKSSAAERTRWPSEPSIASENELSSHGPS